MKKLNKQNGITLIALIITIIVMLILVGVTINVALNGGLFDKAKDAKEKTAAATEKEQLLNAVFATLDDNGNVNLGNIELPDGFEEVSSDDTEVVYEGPTGKQYEVSKSTGAITEIKEDDEDDEGEDLGNYYLKIVQAYCGMIELSEEETSEYQEALRNIMEQGGHYIIFNCYIDDGDYMVNYFKIDTYNYYAYADNTGDTPIITVSLLTKGSDEYNKVNSMTEEFIAIEEELNTLFIDSGYTYTVEDWSNGSIKEDVVNGLSEPKEVNVEWSNGNLNISITSSVDSTFTFRYTVYSEQNDSTWTPNRINNSHGV